MSATETRLAIDDRPRFEGAWETKRLADLLSHPPRYGINAPAVKDDGNLPTYIRITDISDDGRYCPAPRVAVRHRTSSEYFLDPGDLVVARTGASVGKTYTCRREDTPLVFAGFLIQLRPDLDQLEPWYLDAHVRTSGYWSWVKESSARTGQPGINAQQLSQYELQLPPLPEQRAIAAALSDVDDLLQSLDRLIAKKRDVKQGAMQQLLTGTTRLPGFEGAWETKQLGELGKFFKGSGIKKDEVRSEGLPCVRYGEIYTSFENWVAKPRSFITEKTATQATQIQVGDLLFAASGETAEEIGKCVAYLAEGPAFAGGDIVALRPADDCDSLYLGCLLNTPEIARQKSRLGQGHPVAHIGARALGQVVISLPPLPEQRAIAAVLSDMDAEIDALEARCDKAAAIKQGMMQELLTGRTRLPIPKEDT